ncbi:hypothetical protein ACIU1J_01260 [Azospirillum doebereinerae]|uniref:[protein-PII] uridylyltransferase family protein n=1 Tax=Azospirillum doebereinerae TaxID=92933 RepID=UPI00384F9A4F
MIDLEFIAQYLQLRHGHDRPDILNIGTVLALRNAARTGALDPEVALELESAVRLWRRVQGFLRLTTAGVLDPEQVSPTLLAGLARAAFPASQKEGGGGG